MILDSEQIEDLKEAARPLIRFLNEFHPHVKVIVDGSSAEMLEGVASIKNEEFIKD